MQARIKKLGKNFKTAKKGVKPLFLQFAILLAWENLQI